jgi:hypothetical protein
LAAAASAATQTALQTGSDTTGATGATGATGVTEFEAVDALSDVPPALVAVVVKVYAVPFVNPASVQAPLAPVTVQNAPPADAVTE